MLCIPSQEEIDNLKQVWTLHKNQDQLSKLLNQYQEGKRQKKKTNKHKKAHS